jgi:hypothetical protein
MVSRQAGAVVADDHCHFSLAEAQQGHAQCSIAERSAADKIGLPNVVQQVYDDVAGAACRLHCRHL